MRKHWFPKPYADFVMRMRVPSGFLLAVCFGLLAAPSRESLLVGGGVSVSGLALRAWAAGHLKKNQDLADGGPYAWTRNPLYLGTLLTALGLAIAARSWVVFGVTVAVFGLVYLPVIEQEEQHLIKLFAGYRAYAERVPLLWPKLPSQRSALRFESAVYWRNEEWKAGAAFLAGMGYLLWKL
ncbi:methyltransferase family protein [Bryobacter aggregatus]|uniref:methyltransferase family protein n=1 Tax=Bryobacter aggregatus TaxID=360054 RepID=UPI0004E1C7EA|nr:methyltransferase [Bryobacter aggregatus]